jgi:hypothetical protein
MSWFSRRRPPAQFPFDVTDGQEADRLAAQLFPWVVWMRRMSDAFKRLTTEVGHVRDLLALKDAELARQAALLAGKDAERDAALALKDGVIAEKDAKIADLEKQADAAADELAKLVPAPAPVEPPPPPVFNPSQM